MSDIDLTEVWRKIPCADYEVSNLGRVRNLRGNVLTPRVHTNGYHRVSLGAKRDEYIHRLVCLIFHGNPEDISYHADHINGVRHDNRASNLRWLSPSQNRSLRNFARGQRSGCAKLTDEIVRQLRLETWHRGFDAKMAAKLGVSRETVRDVRYGKVWSHVE